MLHTYTLFYGSSVLTGPAEPFSGRLPAAFAGHGACERSRQQRLPEEGGSERERSGGHGSEDAQQSLTDQHHAQVSEMLFPVLIYEELTGYRIDCCFSPGC